MKASTHDWEKDWRERGWFGGGAGVCVCVFEYVCL